MTVFIGDVHGKYAQYERIIADRTDTIQVGDMGVGFRHCGGPRDGEFYANPPHAKMKKGNHRFIRGNHDNPSVCTRHSQIINDGTIENGVMFIGGGLSIDRQFRTEGYSWWPDEELSFQTLNNLVDVYTMYKPRVMVTHECPEDIAEAMCQHVGWQKFHDPSRTRHAFQAMLSAHSPKIWIFGHWHVSFDHVLQGTRFVCLNELEHKDIDVWG